jgi:hypothetical protein
MRDGGKPGRLREKKTRIETPNATRHPGHWIEDDVLNQSSKAELSVFDGATY